VGRRVFGGGGHLERFHPVEVEGGRDLVLGVGYDLGWEREGKLVFPFLFSLLLILRFVAWMRCVSCIGYVLMLTFRAMGPFLNASCIWGSMSTIFAGGVKNAKLMLLK
jgi:hypothetical protein